MKTAMQELIENLTEQLDKIVKEHQTEVNEDTYWRGVKIGLGTAIEVTESLLKKEKKQMIDFAFAFSKDYTTAKEMRDYYKEKFSTNEK